MRRIAALTVLVFFINLIACKRMDFSGEKNQSLIEKSKSWFDTYLSKESVNNVFANANYIWSKARVFTFANGYNAVTVPVMEENQNIKYTGRRILYLFPWKNGKGFYVNLYELLPTFEHYQKNRGNISLSSFDGFILSWDLRKGYVGGAKYMNGTSINDVTVTFSSTQLNIIRQNHRTTTGSLPPVVVYAAYQNSLGQYIIQLQNQNGYNMTYNTGSTTNPCEYTNCNSSEPEDFLDQETINQIMQELADQQWLAEHIKDSTNNPCDAAVIAALKALNTNTLPKLFRDIFNNSANISIVFKSADLGAGAGGRTTLNTATNVYEIIINSHFSNRTTLSEATTILHEMIHAQLMSWWRDAVLGANVPLQQSIATNYGLYFDSTRIALYPDLDFIYLMNQNQGGQHQIMTFDLIRQSVSDALYEFGLALDPTPPIDFDLYCNDLAWAGTSDSEGFQNLPLAEQTRLTHIIEGERGNVPLYIQKGTPCP